MVHIRESRLDPLEERKELNSRDWEKEVFYFPLEPRKPISGFDDSSGFFLSKKIPLRIVSRLHEDKCHEKGLLTHFEIMRQYDMNDGSPNLGF
jgi:hypothetical protein